MGDGKKQRHAFDRWLRRVLEARYGPLEDWRFTQWLSTSQTIDRIFLAQYRVAKAIRVLRGKY